jgi:hypothetical protein
MKPRLALLMSAALISAAALGACRREVPPPPTPTPDKEPVPRTLAQPALAHATAALLLLH